MVFAQLCEYTKNQWIVPFKWVSYMVCKFSLSKAFSFKNKFLKKKKIIKISFYFYNIQIQ